MNLAAMFSDTIKNVIKQNFFVITSDNYQDQASQFFGFAFQDNLFFVRENQDHIKFDKYAAGIFVNIIDYNDILYIQQDFYCGFGLYIFRNKEYWAISNNILLLVLHLKNRFKLSISSEYFALHMLQKVCVASVNRTIINEIAELGQGEYCLIHKSSGKLEIHKNIYDKYTVPVYSRSAIDLLESWINRYSSLCKTLVTCGYNVSVDLTGGFDTRAVLPVWLPLLREGLALTVNSSDDGLDCHAEDYEISRRIAEAYSFNLNEDKTETDSIPLTTDESLLVTLLAKGFVHEQFYYAKKIFRKPCFKFTGNGGEAVRGYGVGDMEKYITDQVCNKKSELNCFKKDAAAFLEQTIVALKNENCDDIEDAQLIYLHSRIKNHYLRSSLESLLANSIQISPLIDPVLTKLDLTRKGIEDCRGLFAVIYDRFLPELEIIPFEGGRSIQAVTWEKAKKLNNNFPDRQNTTYLPIQLKINDVSLSMHCRNSDFGAQPEAYVKKLYAREDVKEFVARRFGYEIYEFAKGYDEFTKYYGSCFISKLVSLYLLQRQLESSTYVPELKPVYYRTDCLQTLMANLNTARLDMRISGGEPVALISSNDDSVDTSYPEWFSSSTGKGLMLQTRKQFFKGEFSGGNGGSLEITFRAIDRRAKDGRRLPYQIDYLSINIAAEDGRILYTNKNVFGVSHDNPMNIKANVKSGEKFSVYLDYRPHDYEKTEFDIICSGHFSNY